MFPDLILYPLWLAIAVLYPIFEALKAVNNKDSDKLRMWMFYLGGGCLLSLVWPVIEIVPYTVFAVLSSIGWYLDWYGEVQIAVAFLLVHPQQLYIKKVLEHVDNDQKMFMDKVGTPVMKAIDGAKLVVAAKFAGLTGGK